MNLKESQQLRDAISKIKNLAQDQQIFDTVPSNEWDVIETKAEELRNLIYDLETPEQFRIRTRRGRR